MIPYGEMLHFPLCCHFYKTLQVVVKTVVKKVDEWLVSLSMYFSVDKLRTEGLVANFTAKSLANIAILHKENT